MPFMDSIRSFLVNFMVFHGRASRSEFWNAMLFVALANVVATVLDKAAGFILLAPVIGIVLLMPGLAVQARRLHDTDVSAWWLAMSPVTVGVTWMAVFLVALNSADPEKTAVALAPIVADAGVFATVVTFLLLAWCCVRGTKGRNRYGSDPLASQSMRRPRTALAVTPGVPAPARPGQFRPVRREGR